MPPVFFSASFMVSRLRSSINFSVTTVMDWGMSRSCCVPLPMLVWVARNASLPSGASAFSSTTTVGSVLFAGGGDVVCDQPLTDAASIIAPMGSNLLVATFLIAGCAYSARAEARFDSITGGFDRCLAITGTQQKWDCCWLHLSWDVAGGKCQCNILNENCSYL